MELDLVIKFVSMGLLATTSFLFKNLISRMEEGNKILNDLRVQLAVVSKQTDIYSQKLKDIENEIKDIYQELESIKKQIRGKIE